MSAKRCCLKAILVVVGLACLMGCQERDLNAQSPIKEVGRYDFGIGYDLFLKEKIVFVSGNKGVRIIDVGIPEKPEELSFVKLKDGAFGMFVKDNWLYIAGDRDGFFIADIADLKKPCVVFNYSGTRGITQDVKVRDSHAYVLMREGTLLVFDVSDASEAKLVSELNVGDSGAEVIPVKDVLYVANPSAGLEVIDITDPGRPKKITSVPGTAAVFSPHIHDCFMYLGCHANGIRILDISENRSPEIIGSFQDGGEANSVFFYQSFLYVVDQNESVVKILDVSDPTNPRKVAENFQYRAPHDILSDGKYIYIASAGEGLVVLEYNKE
jgi:hypothetical protein